VLKKSGMILSKKFWEAYCQKYKTKKIKTKNLQDTSSVGKDFQQVLYNSTKLKERLKELNPLKTSPEETTPSKVSKETTVQPPVFNMNKTEKPFSPQNEEKIYMTNKTYPLGQSKACVSKSSVVGISISNIIIYILITSCAFL